MKTSVEKLYFNWQDPNTGEWPKSYPIQVYAPGAHHDGDLMINRVVKLLKEHSDEMMELPKALLTEIYEDCCWGFAGYLFTSGALAHLGEESYAAVPRNYADLPQEEWAKFVDDITECMQLRITADIGKYLEIVTAMPMPDEFRNSLDSDERVVEAKDEYTKRGDWILGLEDQADMVELALTLLGLRRGFWRAFKHNCTKFVPVDE